MHNLAARIRCSRVVVDEWVHLSLCMGASGTGTPILGAARHACRNRTGNTGLANSPRMSSATARTKRKLREAGWDVLVVWECETESVGALPAMIQQFLES